MHFEILVEDQSGKIVLDQVIPKILDENSSYKVHPYKGIGHLPKNMSSKLDPSKRALLNQLPRILSGYGKAFSNYPKNQTAAVVVVCDLDNRNLSDFLLELNQVLNNCTPKPKTHFCLCIEEGESWLLGHKDAVKTAYPNAKSATLNAYKYDSICGTWEVLADSIFPGGAQALIAKGKPEVGRLKSEWATKISPLIEIEENHSPSFQFFVKTLQKGPTSNKQ